MKTRTCLILWSHNLDLSPRKLTHPQKENCSKFNSHQIWVVCFMNFSWFMSETSWFSNKETFKCWWLKNEAKQEDRKLWRRFVDIRKCRQNLDFIEIEEQLWQWPGCPWWGSEEIVRQIGAGLSKALALGLKLTTSHCTCCQRNWNPLTIQIKAFDSPKNHV